MTATKAFLVESPSKARTISGYLGKDYLVLATGGHIFDLPPDSLGLDPHHGFEPDWVFIRGKKKVFQSIKKQISNFNEIFLAPDPDREGEAIAFHLQKNLSTRGKIFHRIYLREITESGVQSALKEPGQINPDLVESQFARRILDRIAGYTMSPKLWSLKKGLSAGRVQSPVLRWICEREEEIRNFQKGEYFRIEGFFERSEAQHSGFLLDQKKTSVSRDIASRWLDRYSQKKSSLPELNQALSVKTKNLPFKVVGGEEKKISKFPPLPYTTSSLQKDAYSKLKFPSAKTMKLAQSLYEGRAGLGGLITYIRTDSERVSPEFGRKTMSYLNKLGHKTIFRKPKSKKNTQDAHEAIRPTKLNLDPSLLNRLNPEERKLYELIRNRFLESFLLPAIYQKTEFLLSDGISDFQIKSEVLLEKGYLDFRNDPKITTSIPIALPEEGLEYTLIEAEISSKETEPPPRFTEGSLVDRMEKTGIGRPSTYSSTLETLFKRNYIEKKKNFLFPTGLGELVNERISTEFREFITDEFTSLMEKDLDEIAGGNKKRLDFLNFYYDKLEKRKVRLKTEKSVCPICKKGHMVKKITRSGKAYRICSDFPNCEHSEYL